MSGRIKGTDKGEKNADHGSVSPEVAKFLDLCRTTPALRQEAARARKRGKDFSQAIASHESAIVDCLLTALSDRDGEFFNQIARRLGAANLGRPVDVLQHEIQGWWEGWQRGPENDVDSEFPAGRDRNRMPSTHLERVLKLSGFWFDDRKTTPLGAIRVNREAVMRKAKKLGVRFALPGRPRKS